jgi:hypothetical protein
MATVELPHIDIDNDRRDRASFCRRLHCIDYV